MTIIIDKNEEDTTDFTDIKKILKAYFEKIW